MLSGLEINMNAIASLGRRFTELGNLFDGSINCLYST